ncbi:hypothetical protein NY10_674 [Carnobacterium antarcticum]|nr:hypothetical protein NY10_674 [Carnobacterium sp. CP1]
MPKIILELSKKQYVSVRASNIKMFTDLNKTLNKKTFITVF